MKLPSNSKHIQNFSDSLINADTPLHDLPAAASFAQVYARIEGIRILFCVFPEWKFYDDGRVHADPEFQIQNAKPFVPAQELLIPLPAPITTASALASCSCSTEIF